MAKTNEQIIAEDVVAIIDEMDHYVTMLIGKELVEVAMWQKVKAKLLEVVSD